MYIYVYMNTIYIYICIYIYVYVYIYVYTYNINVYESFNFPHFCITGTSPQQLQGAKMRLEYQAR